MAQLRLLSNHRPGHYQNCLLKMSYLRPGEKEKEREKELLGRDSVCVRPCLRYYMLKLIRDGFRVIRGDTLEIARCEQSGKRLAKLGKLAALPIDFLSHPACLYFCPSFSEISAESAIYIQTFAKYFPLSSREDPIFRAISRVGKGKKRKAEHRDKRRKRERKKFANAFTQLRFLRYYNFFPRVTHARRIH